MATIFNDKVISGTISGTTITFTKQLHHRSGYAIQMKYSGTSIAGNAKLQASVNGEDWIDVEDSDFAFTDNAGGCLWDNSGINYNWLKIVCEATTGSVTFEVWMVLKRPKPTE